MGSWQIIEEMLKCFGGKDDNSNQTRFLVNKSVFLLFIKEFNELISSFVICMVKSMN